jgi:sorting nexin-8
LIKFNIILIVSSRGNFSGVKTKLLTLGLPEISVKSNDDYHGAIDSHSFSSETASPVPPTWGLSEPTTTVSSARTLDEDWSSRPDPDNYNPTSKDTITLKLVPEREGIFMFRHVVYVLEGIITTKPFKVVRRYSNFLWLQDCLLKKYPFRIHAVLPPKRFAVDGRYLTDDYFLERRRRGLSRFINLLVKHPILGKDKLVVMFLTEEGDPSVWGSSKSLKIEEEFVKRAAAPAFVARWNEQDELARWHLLLESAEQAFEAVTQLCQIADRMYKRQDAMAADYDRLSRAFGYLNRNLPNVYLQAPDDMPALTAGLRSAEKYSSDAFLLLRDESNALDIGFLEDLKRIREFLASVKELFSRYQRLGGNKIEPLRRRIDLNTEKLSQMTGRPEVRESDIIKLREFIERDKRTVEYQTNRDWLIKECISEELALFQRTQYQISK